jgi:hypothetical protein
MTFECAHCGRGVEVEDRKAAAELIMAKSTNRHARTLCGECYENLSEERVVVAAWLRAAHLDRNRQN